MTIDTLHFTPLASLLGGMLIGLAITVLLVFNARVAGVSGILAGTLTRSPHLHLWRYAFVLGLIAAPIFYQLFTTLPMVENVSSTPTLALAGLLVGIGTQYAGGCTSGHGICGLSRLSVRSLVATLCFMGAAMVTVYISQHGLN